MSTNPYLQQDPSAYPFPYTNFGANLNPRGIALVPNMMGMDYIDHQNAVGRAQANMQANLQASSNIDSLLHVHRRKLQRRAANRKSAQLSRARKKAHLEELKVENLRLQQLVDVLDSQPELVFCVTARGNITYISERTVNFINVSNTDSDNDDDPTHISQILAPDSVDCVLKTIEEIMKTSPPKSALAESSMLFSSKDVQFQDAFGNPLVGTLRCARVNRRPSVEDVGEDDASSVGGQAAPPPPPVPPPAKKTKTTKAAAAAAAKAEAEAAQGVAASNGLSAMRPGVSSSKPLSQLEEWNLTNFRMLTDCVSSLADENDRKRRLEGEEGEDSKPVLNSSQIQREGYQHTLSSLSTGNTTGTSSGSNGSSSRHGSVVDAPLPSPVHRQGSHSSHSSTGPPPLASTSLDPLGDDLENEFVCVIRTSDSYFARYSTRSDLYMFVSTPLSTASMEAHDLKPGNAIARHASLGALNHHPHHNHNSHPLHGMMHNPLLIATAQASGAQQQDLNQHQQQGRERRKGGGSGSGSSKSSNSGVDSGNASLSGSGNDSASLLPKSENSSNTLDKRDNTSSETGSDDNTGENNSM